MMRKIGFWERLQMLFSSRKAQALYQEGFNYCDEKRVKPLEYEMKHGVLSHLNNTEKKSLVTDPILEIPVLKVAFLCNTLTPIGNAVVPPRELNSSVRNYFANDAGVTLKSSTRVVDHVGARKAFEKELATTLGKYMLERDLVRTVVTRDPIDPNITVLQAMLRVYEQK